MTMLSDRVALIDDALDAVLVALLAHRARRAADAPPAPIRATPLRWHGDVREIPTREDSEITALVADPVGAALRQAVRRLGKDLHGHGGTATMRSAIGRVADRDPAKAGQRASIMDHAWDGIGEGTDHWWA